MRARKRPIYIRKPAPVCKLCGLSMSVTHTRSDHRHFRCPNPSCGATCKQERDKYRETFNPTSCQ